MISHKLGETPTIKGRSPAKDYIRSVIKRVTDLSADANFQQNPLANEFYDQFQMDDDDFKISYNKDITSDFYAFMLWKTVFREPITLAISGVQRGGKSSVAISLALIISKLTGVEFPLDASHIHKNQMVYLKHLPQFRPNQVQVIDEQRVSHNQIGSYAVDFEIEDSQHIIAKLCLHTLWLCPDLVERDALYGLKVIALDRKLHLAKCLVIDLKNAEDGFYRQFGYCVIEHYDPSVSEVSPEALTKMPDKTLTPMQLLRKKYEIKKDKWIEEIKQRFAGDRVFQRLEESYKLLFDPIFAKAKNITDKKVVARTLLPDGFTEDELHEIVKMASNKQLLLMLMQRFNIKQPKISHQGQIGQGVLSDFSTQPKRIS
jgi:hypothetical protein